MLPDHAATENGPGRRFLIALVSAVCRWPRTVLLLSVALSTLSVWSAVVRLQYHTSRNDLLSPDKDYQKRWQQYLAEFGDDDDIVVVVRGGDRECMKAAVEALADRVRQKPELFDRLFYKADLRHLRNRALLLLGDDEVEAIRRHVSSDDMNRLLGLGSLPWQKIGLDSPSWRNVGLKGMLIEAKARLEQARESGRTLSREDEDFFAQLLAVARTLRATLDEPEAYTNPWGSAMPRRQGRPDYLAEPQYFFSGDGVLAFLLARPVKDKGSFTAALNSVAAMRAIVAEVRGAHPDLEIGMTGMPVLETDEMAAAERDTRLASYVAVGGVTLLFFLVYRGIWYPLLTVGTLLIGTTWAMGWTTLTVGHLNILSATFAVMLIGMGDYGVLWVMRYEQARRLGADVRAALLHTTTHVAVGNLTAAATLALAFFAAIFADFKAVAELGWIAGCGVLLCAFACFTFLPALLTLFDRRETATLLGRAGGRPSLVRRIANLEGRSWLPGLMRRPVWVFAVAVLVIGGMGACAARVYYDHNLLHLQADDLESVKWEMILIEKTAGASWHALSYRDTAAQALALKARYERLPEVSQVIEVASLVPPHQAEKLAKLRDIHERLAGLPPRHAPIPHDRPSAVALRKQLVAVTADATLPDGVRDGLRQLHDRLGSADEARLQDFDERLAQDLAEDLHQLADVATPEPITVDDLPPSLRERYVSPSGKYLLRVFAKDCLWDFQPLEHFTERIRRVDPEATGKPFGTVEGLKAMKDGLIRAGVYAFLVIAAVLLLDFRSVRCTVLALAPLVLGVLLTLGVMGACNFPLNPANMIAFPLILGVGVDNGVHVLHDYLLRRDSLSPLWRAGGEESAVRGSVVSHAIGRGVLVKALTTMIGFGTLMISSERGLAGLGFILTLGVCCSMLTALVLLPAVLSLTTKRQEAPAPLAEPLVLRRAA
jgi:hopanoid biosynthesis associated RND transporter like protein HpnN